MMLSIRALGSLTIRANGVSLLEGKDEKRGLLIVYLAEHSSARHAPARQRESVAHLLWPSDSETARVNLRSLLHRMRNEGFAHYLNVDHRQIALNDGADISYDVAQFEALGPNLDGVSVDRLMQTADLYRGDFLASVLLDDYPYLDEWVTARRTELEVHAVRVLTQLITRALGEGTTTDLRKYAARLVRLVPYDDDSQLLQMRALAASGQIAAALRAYSDHRRRMQTEMQIEDVSPELREFAAILQKPNAALQLVKNAPQRSVPDVQAVRIDAGDAQVTDLTEQVRQAPAQTNQQEVQRRRFGPAPRSHLFGRWQQIRRIIDRLLTPGERLVTLVGIGGSGKTVMAQTIAAQLADNFRAGVSFVTLSTIEAAPSPDTNRTQVLQAIAAALDLNVNEAELKGRVRACLRAHELLLVLDNYEHLQSTATLVAELLEDAPRLRILVTSRTRLNLHAETVETIDGLPTPAPDALMPSIEKNPAVQLFTARARRALAGFTLSEENAEAVGRICRCVGGLPLGIELAAHWVTLFSPAEIADAVEHQLNLLVTPHSDVEERHRSILNLFNHSWTLLSTDEQRMLAAVSIFQHTFARPAVIAVAASELATSQSLVNRHLLRVAAPGWFSLHPLVRHYAAEKRKADAALNADVERRFYTFVLEQLHPGAHGALRPNSSTVVHEMRELEPADVMHAWELATDRGDEAALARALPHFAFFWRAIGRHRTVLDLLDKGAAAITARGAASSTQRHLAGEIHHQIALTCQSLGEHEQALRHGERAMSYLGNQGAHEHLGWLLSDLGGFYLNAGRSEEAIAPLEEARAIGDRLHDPNLEIDATWKLIAVYWARGSYPKADRLYALAVAAEPTLDIVEPDRAGYYVELFNQAAFRQDWARAEQFLNSLDNWYVRHPATFELLATKRELRLLLYLVQDRWDDAYQLAQVHVADAAQSENHGLHTDALLLAAHVATKAESTATALTLLAQADRIAALDKSSYKRIELDLAAGRIHFGAGDIKVAEAHFKAIVDAALRRPAELFSIRWLIAAIYYLAQIRRAELPDDLFRRAVSAAAIRPQTGFLTRLEAQRLVASEGLTLAGKDKNGAHKPVDLADLMALLESIVDLAEGTSLLE